jgi:ABC-type xylose transport system permease subunit
MRRVGKLRYVCMQGFLAGAIMAAAMVTVAWIKAGTLEITVEAIVAFVIGGLLGAARARAEWNKFASIYSDVGGDRR